MAKPKTAVPRPKRIFDKMPVISLSIVPISEG
jgi:hypothetical protein